MATKEATANDDVKQLLVDTPGITPDTNGGWVGRLKADGGVSSSQSHLLADLHEVDNSFAKASRLITSIPIEDYDSRRDEIIAALAKTSKPYFGDVSEMTYEEWASRFAERAFPWVDPTWHDRFHDLLQRVEARLNEADHGEIPTLFPSLEDSENAPEAVAKLIAAYPNAKTTKVNTRDEAWFPTLIRKHVKPMPWTTAIDGDLKEWFAKDTLWQAQDPRYDADGVRIIPGPVAVAGITKKNEPVAELLGRFEDATTAALGDAGVESVSLYSRLASAKTAEEFLRNAPTIMCTVTSLLTQHLSCQTKHSTSLMTAKAWPFASTLILTGITSPKSSVRSTSSTWTSQLRCLRQ